MSVNFVLRNASVLDETGDFSDPLDIHVSHGRVIAVGKNLKAAADSIDFSNLWVMPGVVDCHDHVALSSMDALECLRTPITLWALEAAENARKTLRAGVTLVRDASGADAGMRSAIDKGFVLGPRLQVSTVALTQTGGHVDGFLVGPGFEMSAEYLVPDYPGRPPVVVDGVTEMQRAVRAVLRSGADWIKLTVTGGVISEHAETLAPEFTLEEIQVAVYEAARRGKQVMAHGYGGAGVDNAIQAGVRSIEHGTFLTEQQMAHMRERDCWLVPTLSILYDILSWSDKGMLPAYAAEKGRVLRGVIGDVVPMAREYGVKMALGTDYLTRDQHGGNLAEIFLMHQAGLSTQEALLTATIRGAELCGVSDRYGRIAPGYMFDAVVLDQDPSDLAIFARRGSVSEVFKAGTPVLGHPRLRGTELAEIWAAQGRVVSSERGHVG